MMFSAQEAGILATRIRANGTLVPVDPAFVPDSSGVVLHGGASLGNGSYRRTSPVMLIEVPNSGNTRLRVTSNEDASAFGSLLSVSSAPVVSDALTAYSRSTSGSGYAGVTFTPFSARKTIVQSPLLFKMGAADVTSADGFVSPTVTATRRNATHAPSTVASWAVNADESVWNIPPVGRYVGATMAQGLMGRVLSDVEFKLANVSAMADQGTYLSMRAYMPESTLVVGFTGTYVGNQIYTPGNYSMLVAAGGILRYSIDPAFRNIEPSPGSTLLVISGKASTDLIVLQKGV